jgi:hypothetical protein
MECCFRYASKLGDAIIPTAKTAPHRHRQQLRTAVSTGRHSTKLPDTSCISPSERSLERPVPSTSHNGFCYSYRDIRYTDNVARGSGELVPRWLEASMGSWTGSNDRPIHVQESSTVIPAVMSISTPTSCFDMLSRHVPASARPDREMETNVAAHFVSP